DVRESITHRGAVMQTARKIAMAGAVTPFLIPKHGFYAPRDGQGPTQLPEELPVSATLRTIQKELLLRARLSLKGFWRGLKGTGVVGVGRLYATVIRATGEVEHLGLLCTKVITDAGVAFLVDDWDVNTASATNDITTLKYHACGTGTGAEAAGDTALGTES